jgi:hypothetical protein
MQPIGGCFGGIYPIFEIECVKFMAKQGCKIVVFSPLKQYFFRLKRVQQLINILKGPSAVRNSPVEISRKAAPAILRRVNGSQKVVFAVVKNLSLIETPGVTISVIPFSQYSWFVWGLQAVRKWQPVALPLPV